MKITILGQGLNNEIKNSVGSKLIDLLSLKSFKAFTAISAFTSQAGINGLSNNIALAKNHIKNITIVTGVDQKGTSKEALEALLKLDINAYVFFQPSMTIFHPKLYLFEGKYKSELIIGSSNLTAQGLFSNVEASLLVSIDNNIISDRNIVKQIKHYFKTIFDFTDPNLKKLDNNLIVELVKAKIVPTEAERKALQDKTEKSERSEIENDIYKLFPKRTIAKIPIQFRGIRTNVNKSKVAKNKTSENVVSKPSAKGKLVWVRKKLPASSVQVSVEGTNPTGALRLVQDDFIVNEARIDQTKYFRDELFRHYHWKQIKTNPLVEVAIVPFEVTIRNKFIGKYDLEIRHKPSGEAGQHNYTTSISWGKLGNDIREAKLAGARLEIYAPKGRSKVFHINII